VSVRLNVNGVVHEVDAAPSDALLWVLRDDLGLPGAKYGCGLEQCGACRVLVAGLPVSSCRLEVGDLDGQEVVTLEGLADDADTRAVQDALLARNAGQCGYCLPGIVVTLGHLARRDDVERADVIAALDAHLCRCGSQPRIIAAALAALGIDRG
jgi:nicotinate dehydrogenase subunit A